MVMFIECQIADHDASSRDPAESRRKDGPRRIYNCDMTELPPEEGRNSWAILTENWCKNSLNGRNFDEDIEIQPSLNFLQLSLASPLVLNQQYLSRKHSYLSWVLGSESAIQEQFGLIWLFLRHLEYVFCIISISLFVSRNWEICLF
jgi:hypothetical protein